MIYDEDITFNRQSYINILYLLEILIKDQTLIRITADEKQTLMNTIENKLLIN